MKRAGLVVLFALAGCALRTETDRECRFSCADCTDVEFVCDRSTRESAEELPAGEKPK